MEEIYAYKRQNNEKIPFSDRFNPDLPAGATPIKFIDQDGGQKAHALWEAYRVWDERNYGATNIMVPSGNPVQDAIRAVFGTEGLFSMRKNADVHPLAQIVGIGRSLIEAGILNLGIAGGSAVVGGVATRFIENAMLGALTETSISFFMMIATITLTLGFVLYYIVPFLPFIYFFFAVGGWIKGVFEAMVGAPLWALAHIRIDGDGLPGQAALSGYFLVLEVFIRPILIIFGLIAGISIFAASVNILNIIWDTVITNLTGFDYRLEEQVAGGGAPAGITEAFADYLRGPIDQFFYTAVYAVIVYMIGMSCFKLVDQIPNSILRWMGSSVESFNDMAEDAAQGLMGRASIGTQQTLSSLQGSTGQLLTKVAGVNKGGVSPGGGTS